MAITRSQQAKQMLQDGGLSLQNAKDMAPKGEFLAYINNEEAKMLKKAGGSGVMTNAGIPSFDRDEAMGMGGKQGTGGGKTGTGGGGVTGPAELGKTTRGPDRTAVGPDSKFAQNRNKRNIDRMRTGLRNVISPSTQPGNRAMRYGLNIFAPGTGELFARTIDRLQPDIFGSPRGFDDPVRGDEKGETPLWMQLGYNSEAEYNAAMGRGVATSAPVESDPPVNLNRMAYRLMADGGAVIDDEPRQAYGLGSIVKKAARAVKKVAKSDLGKAAIAAAGIYYAGGGNLFGLQRAGMSGFGFGNLPGAGFFTGTGAQKAATAKGAGFFRGPAELGITTRGTTSSSLLGNIFKGKTGLATAGILAASALPLLGVGVEEEEENEGLSPYLGEGLDIAGIRSDPFGAMGQSYRLMAEGGDTEDAKEPVAKKVMPLLDMDGMEKDYRAEGGFVPIGRMEKADDVPARLSKNEFVFTADAVRNAGDGNVDKGAEVMYNMMKNLEAGGEVSEESQGLEGARRMFQTSKRLEEVL